jgi:hypothetical protein
MTTYTIHAENIEKQSEKRFALPTFTSETQAEGHAAHEAKTRGEDWHVYLEFFRSTDGCRGYINRDGASSTGRPW